MNETVESHSLSMTRRLRAPGSSLASDSLPTRLLTQAVRRLRVVILLIVGMTVVGWIGVNAVEGDFLEEFERPGDWIPPSAGLAFSLALYFLTRSSRIGVLTILKFGLAYQVVVSFGIAIGQYWNTFHDLSGDRLTPDLVGVSAVALWMAFFTVLVPSRPRHAFVALTLSGAAVPTTMAVLIRMGDAPRPSTLDFVTIFVLPYAVTVIICMVCARVIYGLGRDASEVRRLGSYELQTLLGSGGMGSVWSARHDLLARPAAIKLIRPEALSTDPVSQQAVLSQFESEAQITAGLQSPHTVALYDFGLSDDGEIYYVMELLKGIDLDQMVRRFGPVPESRVIYILRQACESLAEAHSRGLVHRDIKPANLMLCENALSCDFLKVLDFGLARRRPGLDEGRDDRVSEEFLGTPAYAAPESIADAGAVDGRTDLYSLGAVGYWLLTGRPPFAEPTTAATLAAHLTQRPDPPSRHSQSPVARSVDDLILGCLEKSRDDRPDSALALSSALEALALDDEWTPVRAREWWKSHRPA